MCVYRMILKKGKSVLPRGSNTYAEVKSWKGKPLNDSKWINLLRAHIRNVSKILCTGLRLDSQHFRKIREGGGQADRQAVIILSSESNFPFQHHFLISPHSIHLTSPIILNKSCFPYLGVFILPLTASRNLPHVTLIEWTLLHSSRLS